MTGGRWEHGSTFAWPWTEIPRTDDPEQPNPWGHSPLFVGSGRQALALLVEFGQATRGWRRLWTPTYFCQPVLAPVLAAGIEIATYPDSPDRLSPQFDGLDRALRQGDVVLVVNYLGLRSQPDLTGLVGDGIDLVEDHTHDPWSPWAYGSTADFCLASLRKTLPLPDGAVIWSPLRQPLPAQPQPSSEHECAAAWALQASLLKELSLRGQRFGPDDYRALAVAAEEALARARPSAVTSLSRKLVSIAPAQEWRATRMHNFEVMASELEGRTDTPVLRPQSPSAAPFAVTIRFKSQEEREKCREQLIASQVYPAVLWPLDDQVVGAIPDRELELSRRLLSLHCDMRYGRDDLVRVAATFALTQAAGRTTAPAP